jgi:tetratricopeptide (TPR) repeat protein
MLQDATQKRPVEPLAFYYLSDAAERLGHYDVARQALLDYEVLRGDETDARRRVAHATRLGDLSLRVSDPAAAATYFLRAATDSSDASNLLARAADAQMRAGDREAARATALKALEKDPANTLALTVQRRLGPPRAQSPKPKARS